MGSAKAPAGSFCAAAVAGKNVESVLTKKKNVPQKLRQYVYSCTSKGSVTGITGVFLRRGRVSRVCGKDADARRRKCVTICTFVPVQQGN
jgi:hypothetical protein